MFISEPSVAMGLRVSECLSMLPQLKRGRSSVVEHLLPKQNVVGSIPIARSNF